MKKHAGILLLALVLCLALAVPAMAADEPFAVQAVTQEAARLVQALLPGAKPISRYYIASVQSLPESEKEDDVHGGD